MNLRRQGLNFFKIFFAVGLVFWLIKTDRFKLEELKPFLSPANFLLGLLFLGLNLTLMSERWRLLMRAQSLEAQAWPTWKLNLTGIFFNFAVPGGVGGDVVKAYYLQKELGCSRAAAFSSALMDRVVGLYTCVLMALVALIYERLVSVSPQALLLELLTWVSFLFSALTIGLLVVGYVRYPTSWQSRAGILGRLARFAEACQDFIKRPGLLLMGVGLTVFAQLVTVVFFRWAFESVLDESVSWSLLLFVVPVGFMIMAVPITPAGVGVGQAVFYFLFQSFSQNQILNGSSVITAFQLMQFTWGLLGAYFYLTRRAHIPLSSLEESTRERL